MRTYTPEEAIEEISSAANAAAIFGSPADPADRRGARQTFRALAWAVHPDRSGAQDRAAAEAMARLNLLHDQWTAEAAGQEGGHRTQSGPYVEGRHGVIRLKDRIEADAEVATYATDRPTVFVDLARTEEGRDRVRSTTLVFRQLADAGLAPFVPNPVDRGVTQGRAWEAWEIPAGLVSLREVHAAYPGGLDGRDWAWMARRVLMVLATSPLQHSRLGLDTIRVEPQDHGIVLTGWAIGGRQAATTPTPVALLAGLFPTMLDPRETRQLRFAARASDLDAQSFLREYDVLIGHLYGPRRFRPFNLPDHHNEPRLADKE